MKTRALASLAAAASLTLFIPAAGGAQAADNGAGATETDLSTVQKMTAEYLAKQYGLDGATAIKRVRSQEEHTKVAQKAQDELGGESAGSYIDQKRGVLVVHTTRAEATNKIKAADTEVKVVARSESTLQATKQSIAGLLSKRLLATRVDVARNVVVATVADKDVRRARESLAAMDGVIVEGTEAAPTTQEGSVYGGQEIQFNNGYVCSLGFNATKGSQNVFVTAGHCGRGYATFRRQGQPLGRTLAYDFPGRDMGYSSLGTGWKGEAGVDRWNGRGVAVRGSKEAPVGAAVCKSGRTTKWTCGTIEAKNVTVNYTRDRGGYDMVYGLTQTNTCTEGGDSGGSWISGDQAQGVTSGGSGYGPGGKMCGQKVGRKNVSYFQPINPILQKYGLKLKTYQG
ncbi:Alpha-lytic protease [Austwickia sp. TVS 96-490-7B]|uniref:S1 family peptidase n=1 Tax=Austwickia sp. TVS 96-490-7B TaxID=2830843 RepID=UPI001C59DB19|nr:S1 family peptidase [Austwickia sp. TVS 96-490-7B]MBW3085951.1 Alpha-lytic protease [Austwickia sp. TVS 96-490-7B]